MDMFSIAQRNGYLIFEVVHTNYLLGKSLFSLLGFDDKIVQFKTKKTTKFCSKKLLKKSRGIKI